MPSTFSTNLGIELITTGEQAGTWGATTNTNLGTLIEQAISGYVAQVITDGADTVITIPSGSTGVARNMTLELTGALSAARNLIVPSNRKLYFIYNNTTGGYAVTVKVSGQTGVSVPNGAKVLLVSNGTDIVNAVNYISDLYFSAGTAAAPSISTIGDTNTGVYFPAADKVAIATGGTQRVIVDDSGNVGVGTGSPSGKLHVAGALYTNDATSTSAFLNSAGYGVIGTTSNHPFSLWTNGTRQVTVDTSGNLGIGTTSPTTKLHVQGIGTFYSNSTGTFNFINVGRTSSEARIGVAAATNDFLTGTAAGDTTFYSVGTGNAWYGVAGGSGNIIFTTNNTARARIDSSGNLGIGTTNTTGGGKVRIVGGTQPLVFDSTGTTSQLVGPEWRASDNSLRAFIKDTTESPSGGEFRIATNLNDSFITFATNNNLERARIDSSGNLGIGTSSPATTLHVQSGTGQIRIQNTTTGTALIGFRNSSTTDVPWVGTGGDDIRFITTSAERMRLDSSGNLGLGVTPSAWSGGFKAIQFPGGSVAGFASTTNLQIEIGTAYYQSSLGTYTYFNTGTAPTIYRQLSGEHRWLTAPSGTAGNPITFTQAMTLDANGNLGVGQTSSSSRLTVQTSTFGDVAAANVNTAINAKTYGGTTTAARNTLINHVYTQSASAYADIQLLFANSNNSTVSSASVVYTNDGAIAFRNGGGSVAADTLTGTERMRLDSSGNLGLGVTPSAWSGQKAIQIAAGSGFISSSDSAFRFYAGTNAYYNGSNWIYKASSLASLYEQADSIHRWYTAPSGTAGNAITFTQAMTLDANGKLRIGTTSGTGPVLTGGLTTTSTETELFIGRSGAVENSSVGDGASIQLQNATNTTACIIQQYSNNLQFFNYTGTVWTERARISSGGNLGIGATSPQAAVNVERSSSAGTVAAGASIVLSNRNSTSGTFAAGGIFSNTYRDITTSQYTAGVWFEKQNSTAAGTLASQGAIVFGTNDITDPGLLPTERARITSGGDFLVGTTSVVGAGGFTVYNNGSTGFSIVNNNNAAATGYVFQSFRRSSVEVGSVTQNGTTGVLYNTTSDLRLKDNITPAPSASDDIDAIQIVSHDWKAAPDEHVKYGVIAQDLNSVAPQAVFQGDDGEEVEKVWGVDYSKLVPMLIKEIQSLRARVAALESN